MMPELRRTGTTPKSKSLRTEVSIPRQPVLQSAARRAIDIFISALTLVFIWPVLGAIILILKRDSPGPAFYRGPRIGKNGKPFKILKFRTMFEEPDSYAGPRITAHGDVRITPFGQWLRDTKLNELPQFWNVLLGDMSLVGPRPEDPEIIKQWPEDLKQLLLSVRPGITSPASIVYRDEEAQLASENILDDYLRSVLPSKLRLDSLYVRNRTLLTDLDVLFTTVYVLITRARAVPVPESRLLWGPFSLFFNRIVYWFIADLTVALLSVSLVGIIWRSIEVLDIGWRWAPLIALAIAIVFTISNTLFGLNRVYWRRASPRESFDLAISTSIAVVALWLLDNYAFTAVDVPDGLFIVTGLTAAAGFIGIRYRERILTGMAWRWLRFRKSGAGIGEPVLIVGAGELGEFAAWLVRKSDLNQAFSIVGMVDDDPRKQNLRFDGIPILGTCFEIPELVKKHDPGLILFAISKIDSADRERILGICRQTGVRTVMVPNIMDLMQKYFHRGTLISESETHPSKRPHVRAGQVGAWLVEIEALLVSGNSEEALQQIAKYKDFLRNQE